jgi:hypothetical protein
MVVSRIKYYKNISTPRYSTWFPYSRSTAFPTQIFRDLLIVSNGGTFLAMRPFIPFNQLLLEPTYFS